MFIDEVIIKVKAGNGGDGSTSFRHEKYVEMGGPDGGNGGSGANIVFEAAEGLKTLIDLRYKKNIKGDNGGNGSGQDRTGASSPNLVIKVPIGTSIKDEETGLVLCDLVTPNQQCIIAKGGRGGKGNAAFKTNKNKAPLTSELGEPGEEKIIKCELMLLADVGLVGFPSVGKSSLISVVSSSKPKIAAYHFTTLSPNLGVVKVGNDSFVIADLPGLIEGSSKGIGLGDKFLRHASRTKLICHVLDMSGSEGRNPIIDYKIIRNEIKNYNEKLFNKEEIVVANKMDLPESLENLKKFKNEYPDLLVYEISAVTHQGVKELMYAINEKLKTISDTTLYEEHEFENYILYEFKNEKPYKITREGDAWVISGKELERLLKMTRFNSDESAMRFAKKLKYMGIDAELKSMGAKEGDTVRILDFEFDYEEHMY